MIGWFGELHPSACEALDVEGPLVAFEIVLDDIPGAEGAADQRPSRSSSAPSSCRSSATSPSSSPRATRAADILKAALAADRALLAGADVFDVYRGPGVPEGHKSVAVSVTLQPRERTLTDAEIDAAVAKIVAEVAKKTGATLRG